MAFLSFLLFLDNSFWIALKSNWPFIFLHFVHYLPFFNSIKRLKPIIPCDFGISQINLQKKETCYSASLMLTAAVGIAHIVLTRKNL